MVGPKKSSTFAADFAINEKWSENQQWSLRDWSNNVVQESRNAQLGNWKTCNTILYYTVPVNKYTIEKVILS